MITRRLSRTPGEPTLTQDHGQVARGWSAVDRQMRRSKRMQVILVALVMGLVVNFAWEMAQAVLYESMGTVWQATWRCFVASLADAAMVLALVGVGWAVCRRAGSRTGGAAVVALGIVLGAAIEWTGLERSRWAYNEHMPLIYGTQIGVVPVLQMTLLPLLVFHVTRRAARRARHTK